MPQKLYFIFTIVLVVLISCSKDENDSPFPIIETIGSQIYSSGGVKLEGNISNLGNEEILDYGFELYTNGGNISYNVNHHVELPAKRGKYFLEIKHDLYPNLEYAYTAYIRTKKDIYKGERLNFISNGSVTPIMNICSPSIAHVGDTISLDGSNFPTNKNDIEFKYGGSYAQIISTSESEIVFAVPNPSNSNKTIEIEAYNNRVTKEGLLTLYTPVISNISPSNAFFGDTIVLEGDHFNLKKQYTNIEIGGIRAEMLSTSRNKIEVIVPKDVNYSNQKIDLFAQRQYISYSNFSMDVPKFISVPTEVYVNEYFEIKVDRRHPDRNTFFIGGNEIYSEIVDDETLRFYLSSGLFEQRENYITWNINDKKIKTKTTVKISNPFHKIKYGLFLFEENYKTFTIGNEVIVIGFNDTDNRRYLYKYNDLTNEWSQMAMLGKDGSPLGFGPDESGIVYTYSEYDNAIYGLHESQYADNFIKINISNGEVTFLPKNHDSSFYGKGFAYKNKVFFLSGVTDKLWCYNIDDNTWSITSNTPFEKGNYRELYIDVIVVNDYAYFLNGSNGSLYNDFWRMNLSTYSWERLPNNPTSNKYSTAFSFKGELYSITGDIWKYSLSMGLWTQIEKSGIGSDLSTPIRSFIQNDVPYIITHDEYANITYLNLFKGDLLE